MYKVKDGTAHTIECILFIFKRYLVGLEEKGFKRDGSQYTLVEEEKGFNVTIIYGRASKKAVIYLKVDLMTLLNKTYIDEDDIKEIENKIKAYIFNLFQYKLRKIKIRRFDCRIDLLVSTIYKNIICDIIGKRAPTKYREYIRYDLYMPQTIYYNARIKRDLQYKEKKITVRGEEKSINIIKYNNDGANKISKSKTILLYDKEQELLQNGKIDEALNFKDVLRIEISLRNRHLKYRYKKNGEQLELTNYLNREFCKDIFNRELSKIIEESSFHKLNDAKKLIMQSNFKNKDKLNVFLSDVNNHSLEVVRNNPEAFGLKTDNCRQYIKKLNEIDVNIICLKDKDPIEMMKSPIRLINEYFENLK